MLPVAGSHADGEILSVLGARRVLGFVQDRHLHDLPQFPPYQIATSHADGGLEQNRVRGQTFQRVTEPSGNLFPKVSCLGELRQAEPRPATGTNNGLDQLWRDYGKPFWANPYLNAMVFSTNMDSVLNDIGMLLACGVIKKIDCESVQKLFSTAAGHKFVTVVPSVPPVFDSKAYDKSDSGSSGD
jgi:hypothetical protein